MLAPLASLITTNKCFDHNEQTKNARSFARTSKRQTICESSENGDGNVKKAVTRGGEEVGYVEKKIRSS